MTTVVVYYTILYNTIPYHTVLNFIILEYTTPYNTIRPIRYYTILYYTILCIVLHLSNLTHFVLTFVQPPLLWTYICRTSLTLDLHLTNFTYFGFTFVELHLIWNCSYRASLLWTYICRTSLMLDLHLSIFTYFVLTFHELYCRLNNSNLCTIIQKLGFALGGCRLADPRQFLNVLFDCEIVCFIFYWMFDNLRWKFWIVVELWEAPHLVTYELSRRRHYKSCLGTSLGPRYAHIYEVFVCRYRPGLNLHSKHSLKIVTNGFLKVQKGWMLDRVTIMSCYYDIMIP